MKTFLLTIAFTISSTFLYSQNWEILNSEVTSYYSHSDSLRLTNTINIDSTVVDGNEELFFISNKYKVCDTCDFDPNYEVIIHRYAKEFLGFELLYRADSNYYEIEGNVLKHQSIVGDQWEFNSDLIATVQSISQEEIIGELDSVKTIVLSSNDTILLAKNHGIIRCPDFENQGKYYELKGYHNSEWYYGEVFPNFWSIYDFAVGDEYCGNYGYGYLTYYSYTKQIEIVSLLSINETGIIYETIELGSITSGSNAGEPNWSQTTFFNTGNSTQPFERYEDQLEDLFGNKMMVNQVQVFFPDYEPYFQSIIFEPLYYLENILVSENSYASELGYNKNVRGFSSFGDSLLYFNMENSNNDFFQVKYANHIGRVAVSDFVNLDAWSWEGLNGAILNGDTIGDFCDFPFDLGIESYSIDHLSIHPNPAKFQINIVGNYESLYIYSQTGQLVMKIEEPTNLINVEELSPGIYLVKAIAEDKIYTTKLVIE